MKKVGIITYHAAYNFGSVLQAFATQYRIEHLGFKTNIINYRMKEQKKFYGMYRAKYGRWNMLQDFLLIPLHTKRKIREHNFEIFFSDYMKLTEEFSEPEKILELEKYFDIFVSGSDQIWNKNSCEMVLNKWQYMKPYLLSNIHSRKISYASSIGHMSDDDLKSIISDIDEFNALSFREFESAHKISILLGRKVNQVLDPTFLLTKKEWINTMQLYDTNETPYILFYSLKRFSGNAVLKKVISLAREFNYHLKVIMPFSYYPLREKFMENHVEYGPKEFLNSLYNATIIITDSFHGTALSINFEKNFFSICSSGGAEFRKTELLKSLKLEERIISNIESIKELLFVNIDYSSVKEIIKIKRDDSINYLDSSLKGIDVYAQN